MFTKLVVLGLIVYASITLIGLSGRIEDAKAGQADLQEAISALAQENAAYEHEIDNKDDPETIERIARSKYNLVMPGEKIFYGVSN